MSVVDASLLVDVIVGLPAGRPWRAWLAESDALAAPDCAGVEFARYLRRHTLSGHLSVSDAEHALGAFHALGIQAYPTGPLLVGAFALRENFSLDDALYVALAQLLEEPIATTDARLERAAAAVGVPIAAPE